MGAALHLPIVESRDIAADLSALRQADYTLVATVIDSTAEPLAGFTRPRRLALLLGGEGHGLAPGLRALCHHQITIPMQLGIDSLNVAVATAVFLYHLSPR
jgi:tRNA G18 (ribose-2'-O)-methylase SpoU